MAKSGIVIRVGTTVPGSQAHTPTVYRAVGGDSANTQAQPGPGMCGNMGGLCTEAETGRAEGGWLPRAAVCGWQCLWSGPRLLDSGWEMPSQSHKLKPW